MTSISSEAILPGRQVAHNPFAPLATLAARRFQLSVRTPRELVVPLLTPILFALVIAPALKQALHTSTSYESFVATGTIGLLTPLNTMFAAIGARARGIHFDTNVWRVDWFLAAGARFTIGMYGVAETLAARVPRTEEYIGRVPAIAIVPWFLAGSLFPIDALPGFLTWFAKFLPLTHGLALVRYGLLGNSGGLHDIWGMHSTTMMATLSLGVVAAFAAALTAVSIRVFNRFAVR